MAPLVALAVAVGAIRLALFVLGPGPVRLDSHDLSVPWSGVVGLDPATFDRIESITGAAVILLLLTAAASLLMRFWAGNPDTRRRLTPLGLAVATMVLGIVLQSVPGFDAAGVVVFVLGGAASRWPWRSGRSATGSGISTRYWSRRWYTPASP